MAKDKWDTHVKPKLFLVECWARDGLTNEQIASNLGISKTTFYKCLKQHVELSELLKKSKEIVDYQVENALLKRALGYEYTETKTKTDSGGIEITTTTKQVIPDTTAQIFWLKNRRPDKWRDRTSEDESILQSEDDPLTKSLRSLTEEKK